MKKIVKEMIQKGRRQAFDYLLVGMEEEKDKEEEEENAENKEDKK